jgi:hypothetical protein
MRIGGDVVLHEIEKLDPSIHVALTSSKRGKLRQVKTSEVVVMVVREG